MIPTPHWIDEATAYNNIDKQNSLELWIKILSLTTEENIETVRKNLNKIFDTHFDCRCCRLK